MEPLSIATACVSLATGVGKLLMAIGTFVSEVRDARKDMDAVSRELSSLSLCLEALREDCTIVKYPENLQLNLVAVLRNCDLVVKEMEELLKKLSSGNTTARLKWSFQSRDEMDKLRSRLEAHKSTIEIALDMVSISLLNSVKADTGLIREDTAEIREEAAHIKQDTAQIATLIQEINFLRLQVSQLEDRGGAGGLLLERFLADSNSYAESVIDVTDQEASDPQNQATQDDSSRVEEVHWGANPDVEPESNYFHSTAHSKERMRKEIRDDEGDLLDEADAGLLDGVGSSDLKNASTIRELQSGDGTSVRNISMTSDKALPTKTASDWTTRERHGSGTLTPSVTMTAAKSDQTSVIRPTLEEQHLPSKPLDHQAIEAAHSARLQLSREKREALDSTFLRLLNGEGGFWRKTKWGSLSEIRELVDRGADVNAFLPGGLVGKLRGQTALRVEIENARRINVVEFLLKRGADVALLHVAIRRTGPEITKLLLDYGADVDAKDDRGEPALYTAAREGKLPLVKLLLEHGADPNIKGGIVGNALTVAIMKGLNKIAETLLDHGANNGSSGGPYGDALHVAVAWGKVDIVELLLNCGADANAKGSKYGSPLQTARRSPHCEYRDRIREILKEHGAKD